MNEFLASLDQWAFQILMVLYHLMGVQDLPSEASPHWKVVERWSEQPGGHYRLVLESETIQEECRSGRARYIIFPQTNMSKQEIYLDEIRIYTNEINKEWQIRSFLDQPVISCDLISASSKLKMIIHSYMKYYNSINYWHKFSLNFPTDNMLHNFIYMAMGFLAAFVSITCFVIIYFFGIKSYQLLFMGGAIFLLMYAHYPFFYYMRVDSLHLTTLASILGIAYVLLFEDYFNKLFNKSNITFIFILVMQLALAKTSANLTQVLIITNSTIAIFIMFIRVFHKNIEREQRIVYLVTAFFCSRELYANQANRSGFLNVSLLCFILLLIMIIRTSIRVYKSRIYFLKKEETLKNEIMTIKKLEEANHKIKQILHDIKSPVTSLNFILKSKNITSEVLAVPLERLNDLLKLTSEENNSLLTGWYEVGVLINEIEKVKKEKSHINQSICINNDVSLGEKVFFNPSLIKAFFAELIDNTIKVNIQNVNVKITISLTVIQNEELEIKYTDDGVGVDVETLNKIGILGYSHTGTGIGLSSLKQRITSLGGGFTIDKSNLGFSCTLKLLSKSLI